MQNHEAPLELDESITMADVRDAHPRLYSTILQELLHLAEDETLLLTVARIALAFDEAQEHQRIINSDAGEWD